MEKNKYDLEERCQEFAIRVRRWIFSIRKEVHLFADFDQLFRSSGSIGANYIEANGALDKKDFLMKIRISRKETKESKYWITVILPFVRNEPLKNEGALLSRESLELLYIFNSVIRNYEKKYTL